MPTIKALNSRTGGLSNPGKMPGFGYSLPAVRCRTGSKLRKVKGSVCARCYARKGRYTFANVVSCLERRFDALTADLDTWTADMSTLIRLKYRNRTGIDRYFRWHDSGDLQSVAHLSAICRIARENPDIRFWAPTKESRIVIRLMMDERIPENLTIRISNPLVGQCRMNRAGLPFSTVESGFGFRCPATNQDDKCLDCRECWNPDTLIIDYPGH